MGQRSRNFPLFALRKSEKEKKAALSEEQDETRARRRTSEYQQSAIPSILSLEKAANWIWQLNVSRPLLPFLVPLLHFFRFILSHPRSTFILYSPLLSPRVPVHLESFASSLCSFHIFRTVSQPPPRGFILYKAFSPPSILSKEKASVVRLTNRETASREHRLRDRSIVKDSMKQFVKLILRFYRFR